MEYITESEVRRNGRRAPFFSAVEAGARAKTDESEKLTLERSIGPYELLELVGEGGHGIVFRARQTEPIRRTVALKIIKPAVDSKEVLARFVSERQTLALLHHPNIAHIIDAGTTHDGRPYFVMEYIHGTLITAYCDRNQLTIDERLNLFVQVCNGLQHAHQKGFIHCDIKADNILVCLENNRPLVKIIDFGIARILAGPHGKASPKPKQHRMIGTPEYMSPEQIGQEHCDVDIRSDIYSAGVVLYELLCGALPFPPCTLRNIGTQEMSKTICSGQPPAPSCRLIDIGPSGTEIAAQRKTTLPALCKSLRSEREWIPLKAMDKQQDRRYQTVVQFAADIRNYLQRYPLLAGPGTQRYKARKFISRHRIGCTMMASLALITTAYIVVVFQMYGRLKSSHAELEVAYAEARQVSNEYTAFAQQEAFLHLLEAWHANQWREFQATAKYFSSGTREADAAVLLVSEDVFEEELPAFLSKWNAKEPFFANLVVAEHLLKEGQTAEASLRYERCLAMPDHDQNNAQLMRHIYQRLHGLSQATEKSNANTTR